MLAPVHSPHDKYPEYPAARGPVLLLTCMDLRLMDDVLQFMHHDGLSARYDHVIMAGAALGALGGNLSGYEHWKRTFFDHLDGAYNLHKIQDVYIMEHRDCGAYSKVFKVAEPFGDNGPDPQLEFDCHHHYSTMLEEEIICWAKARAVPIRIKSFLMSLRGDVEILNSKAEYIPPYKDEKAPSGPMGCEPSVKRPQWPDPRKAPPKAAGRSGKPAAR